MANSVRVVREDHFLDDEYLLKKGGLIMMSACPQHSNPVIWGKHVDQFNYSRCVNSKSAAGGKRRAAAFRGFGGGVTLCPVRHFATSEILLLATLLLLRFDLKPVEGTKDGSWGPAPSTGSVSQSEAMDQPDEDVEVELILRADVEGKRWKVVPRVGEMLSYYCNNKCAEVAC